jgi:Ser/Thr protein kinase RdoA (MazF antagonist)
VIRTPDPVAVTRAFGLGKLTAPVTPVARGSSAGAFRLSTTLGEFYVKRIRRDQPEWWLVSAEVGMALERRAYEAGIPMPQPVSPNTPALGYAADVDGHGPVRVYEWIDGRRLTAEDEIPEWLGWVLAGLHRLQLDSVTRANLQKSTFLPCIV